MITREDYLNALELIDQYHQQLNLSDVRRSSSSDKTTISKWLSENDAPVRIQTILTGKSAYGYSNTDWAQKLEYIEDITERQWLKCHLGSKKNWLIFKKLRGY